MPDIKDLTEKIKKFRDERDWTDGTIANHLWALKAFLKFLKEDKKISFYEFDIRIPIVKPPETVEYLEIDELEKLFKIIDISNINGLRLRAFIEVMIHTGLRPTEALQLKKADLLSQPEELEIIGKGGKKRMIYFDAKAHYWINKYLSKRQDEHPDLFVTHGNGDKETRPLNLRSAQYAFQ